MTQKQRLPIIMPLDIKFTHIWVLEVCMSLIGLEMTTQFRRFDFSLPTKRPNFILINTFLCLK